MTKTLFRLMIKRIFKHIIRRRPKQELADEYERINAFDRRFNN
jgi:hypothetical protein